MRRVTLDHCVITVSDWARSNAFYATIPGAELVPLGAGWAYWFGHEQLNAHGLGCGETRMRACPSPPAAAISVLSGRGRSRRRSPTSGPTRCRWKSARCPVWAPKAPARASTSAIRTARSWSSFPTRERRPLASQVPRAGFESLVVPQAGLELGGRGLGLRDARTQGRP